ncbi:hypothetical protein DNTS_023027 [Danionella cerebrum]|uniref:C2H2-type domain-containing protein n=1 Tax=Danionella cerebrum TaxID=2873325 RepID=A0A553QLZ1_9TELE|nr:hypothetical protein DNTS_023027 [Danionella translucida]
MAVSGPLFAAVRAGRLLVCRRRASTVRRFSAVPELTSDSDDEDKLQIVEEESIVDLNRSSPVFQDEDCVGDEENCGDEEKQTENESIENHRRSPEQRGHDENGTPDIYSQLHTCPHCSRNYRRVTALKEHIKLRHQRSEDDYCCSVCGHTFTYRTALVRHMAIHKQIHESQKRVNAQANGHRKFKCNECSKAFKYKHHLKEHLRIHSGEKPYECSNCQKRFSHSGSYSSHLSNKKCSNLNTEVNELTPTAAVKATFNIPRQRHILLREKVVDITNKPLQRQHPLKQINQEPVEDQSKPAPITPSLTAATTTNGVVQTLVLPTVGLVQPITINLSDLQNALNKAMDGSVGRQVVSSSNDNGSGAKIIGQIPTQAQGQTVVLQPQQAQAQQQMISTISVPVVGQDGNAKIILNYNPQIDKQLNAVKVNSVQPTLTQATSTVSNVALPKVVQAVRSNPTEPNATETTKPTQLNIIKPVQLGDLTKTPSILKITPAQAARLVQARATQPKMTHQTLLLVRRADGSQSLVVRQMPVLNSNTQNTELKRIPDTTTNTNADEAKNSENDTSIDYSCKKQLSPSAGIQIKTEPASPSRTEPDTTSEEERELLSDGIKQEGDLDAVSHSGMVHSRDACADNFHNYASCLLCDSSTRKLDISDCIDNKPKESSTTISLNSLLDKDKSGAAERLLPLLTAYSQNPDANEGQLSEVAKNVKLPLEAVKKWYQKMRTKKIRLQTSGNVKNNKTQSASPAPQEPSSTQNSCSPSQSPDDSPVEARNENPTPPASPTSTTSPDSPVVQSSDDLIIVKTEDMEEELQCEPLDLSLPKTSSIPAPRSFSLSPPLPISTQKEPLNLASVNKQALPANTFFVTQGGNFVTGSLPALVAITETGNVSCIGTALSGNKQTILIPQLSYTYPSNLRAKSPEDDLTNRAGMVVLNSCQVSEISPDYTSEEQNDEDGPLMKKRRMLSGAMYACDLCDKIFQKSSSLMRHKYEHTGRRPHECPICNKAFKHKHHLIEHSRLHSGEKPYQCDKCGKRFSHSGSYSQHMNHRYSYCKRDPLDTPEPFHTPTPTPTPPSQLESDERESDEEEPEQLSDLDMSDIRVVRIGEDYDEEGESGAEEEDGGIMEVEIGDSDGVEEEI